MQCRSRVRSVRLVTLCQSQQYFFFSLFDMFENISHSKILMQSFVITSNCLDNINHFINPGCTIEYEILDFVTVKSTIYLLKS
jgi:hypothetical protein